MSGKGNGAHLSHKNYFAKRKARLAQGGGKKPGKTPDFPRLRVERGLTRVVSTENVPESVLKMHLKGAPLFQGYIAGVLIESSFVYSSVISATANAHQEVAHYKQHPSGRREILAYRPTR